MCQFCAISLQEQAVFADIQQNVYPVILLIILFLFVVDCPCLPTLKDFGSGDWGGLKPPARARNINDLLYFSHFKLIKW